MTISHYSSNIYYSAFWTINYFGAHYSSWLRTHRFFTVLQRTCQSIGPRSDHGSWIGSAVIKNHGDQSRSQNPTSRNSHDREATSLGESTRGIDKECVWHFLSFIQKYWFQMKLFSYSYRFFSKTIRPMKYIFNINVSFFFLFARWTIY